MNGHEVWPPKNRQAERRAQRAEQHRMADVTPPSEVARKMMNSADSISAMAARLSIYVGELEQYHGPLERWRKMRQGIVTLEAAAAVIREIATETGT